MTKPWLIGCLSFLLSACQLTEHPPYQKDRAPEYRTHYTGLKGFIQHQNDQVYLLNKAQAEQCFNARIEQAAATQEHNTQVISQQERIMARTC